MMIVIASFITFLTLGFLLLTLVGLPGTWGIVVTAMFLAWLSPPELLIAVSWTQVIVLVAIALFGELIEFAAGAAGVGKLGGSKRAALFAVVGSLVGAIFGMFVGLPIPVPVVGSLVGSILLGAAGAALGAVIGERTSGKSWDGSVKIGAAAFAGRIAGTLGKTICAAIMSGMLIFFAWTRY